MRIIFIEAEFKYLVDGKHYVVRWEKEGNTMMYLSSIIIQGDYKTTYEKYHMAPNQSNSNDVIKQYLQSQTNENETKH